MFDGKVASNEADQARRRSLRAGWPSIEYLLQGLELDWSKTLSIVVTVIMMRIRDLREKTGVT